MLDASQILNVVGLAAVITGLVFSLKVLKLLHGLNTAKFIVGAFTYGIFIMGLKLCESHTGCDYLVTWADTLLRILAWLFFTLGIIGIYKAVKQFLKVNGREVK